MQGDCHASLAGLASISWPPRLLPKLNRSHTDPYTPRLLPKLYRSYTDPYTHATTLGPSKTQTLQAGQKLSSKPLPLPGLFAFSLAGGMLRSARSRPASDRMAPRSSHRMRRCRDSPAAGTACEGTELSPCMTPAWHYAACQAAVSPPLQQQNRRGGRPTGRYSTSPRTSVHPPTPPPAHLQSCPPPKDVGLLCHATHFAAAQLQPTPG